MTAKVIDFATAVEKRRRQKEEEGRKATLVLSLSGGKRPRIYLSGIYGTKDFPVGPVGIRKAEKWIAGLFSKGWGGAYFWKPGSDVRAGNLSNESRDLILSLGVKIPSSSLARK